MAVYATKAEFRDYTGIQTATASDTVVDMCLAAASQAIDHFTNTTFTVVPSSIKLACIVQTGRFVERKDALFGITGSPEMGGETRLLARLDPDVELLCKLNRVVWGAVGGTDESE